MDCLHMKGHANLICKICNTDIEVPMCCEREMEFKQGKLICKLCGSEQGMPICCGEKMKIVIS